MLLPFLIVTFAVTGSMKMGKLEDSSYLWGFYYAAIDDFI
jgi:hypothetical protein